MAMKETIKKILKEETVGGNFTKFELFVLNWIYKELGGENIEDYFNSYDYAMFFSKIKETFGIGNKEVVELLYLYRNNWTEDGFQQNDNVIREKAHKFKVSFYRDVSAWVAEDFYVYATDEDDAYRMADAEEMTEEGVAEEIERGEPELGDWGEVYDSEVFFLENIIKKELKLLKENTFPKISDKLLLMAMKMIDKYLEEEGIDWYDVAASGYDEHFDHIGDMLESNIGVSQEEANFIIGTYEINFKDSADDYIDNIKPEQLERAEKTTFYGTKEYGENRWVEEEATGEGYSEAEMTSDSYNGYVDWEVTNWDSYDSWDEEVNWQRK